MIEIIYEDEELLVVNKPVGLPTQPTVDKKRESLYQLLLDSKKYPYLGLHHRLDAPTSGLVLLTKTKRANEPIAAMFKDRSMDKEYRLWVKGNPNFEETVVENYLKPVKSRGKMIMKVVTSGGDFAKTTLNVVQRRKFKKIDITELSAILHTGRMHQIRIHCRSLNLPILGDNLYGPIDRHFKRLYLHAHRLNLAHPITQKPLSLEAPIPAEFSWIQESSAVLS